MSTLTAEHLKIAIVMVSRANCSGGEAQGVAITLQALHAEFARLEAEVPKDNDGNND